MKNNDLALPPQTVQETMLLPLWGRANYSKLYPELLDDPYAIEIIKKVPFDFTQIARSMGEYGGLAYLVRGYRFDNALRAYLADFPEATVVNLGAGLDTTFSRVDNGLIRWYNLDLPDAIAFRRQFIPAKDRSTYLPYSAFGHAWMDEVDFDPAKGIFILVGGLFMYFQKYLVRDLLIAMAERFPGGGLIFDGISKLGRVMTNLKLRGTGAPGMHFAFSNGRREIERWSPKLKVTSEVLFWEGIRRDPRWSKAAVLEMNMADLFRVGRYVEVSFLF